MRPFEHAGVAQAFEAYPPNIREKLLILRELIFETAASIEGVGKLEETLKWAEPAYVTSQSKSGSAVRIHWKKSNLLNMLCTSIAKPRSWTLLELYFPASFTLKVIGLSFSMSQIFCQKMH